MNNPKENEGYILGDPKEFVRKPITRFSADERTELIIRLEALPKKTGKLYEPSLFGLLECLKHDGDSGLSGYTVNFKNEVEDYILVCLSPPHTWRARIGTAGFFTVDPVTLAPKSYKRTAMN